MVGQMIDYFIGCATYDTKLKMFHLMCYLCQKIESVLLDGQPMAENRTFVSQDWLPMAENRKIVYLDGHPMA